ncbi:MAG: hypothetical protein U1F36_04405 [Planctomycetota bacterium]
MERGGRRFGVLGTGALLAVLAACGRGEFETQPGGWPAQPAERTLAAISRLLPAAQVVDDHCVIRFGKRMFEVVGSTKQGEPIVFVKGLRIAVRSELVARGRLEEVIDLLRRAELADGAAPTKDPTFAHAEARFDPLFRIAIVTPDKVVVPRGTLTRTRIAADEAHQAEQRAALDSACDALLAASGADAEHGQLLQTLIAELRTPGPRTASAKRRVRHGELVELCGDTPESRAVAETVEAGCAAVESERWNGPGFAVEVRNRNEGTPLQIDRSAAAPRVALDAAEPAQCSVVVELEAGTDPCSAWDADAIRSVELFRRGQSVARSNPAEGFVCNATTWRKESKDPSPPHILIENPCGDLVALCTAKGMLRIPAEIRSASMDDDFTENCADLLGDGARLQLLLRLLTEAPSTKPDVAAHLDPSRARATLRGGVMTIGDDDAVYLVLDVLARQGRRGVALGTPGDLVAAWAETDSDGVRLELLSRSLQRTVKAASIEEAMATASPSFPGGSLAAPTWVLGTRIDARGIAVAELTDVQSLIDADHARVERQVLAYLDAGRLATAADFLSDEIEHARSTIDTGIVHRLAGLRLSTGEPRGALALLDRTRNLSSMPATRLALAVESLLAAIAAGDESAVAERLQTVRSDLATGDPNDEHAADRTALAVAGIAMRLLDAGRTDLGLDLLLPTCEAWHSSSKSQTNATTATNARALVVGLISLVATAPEGPTRESAARWLARIQAATEAMPQGLAVDATFTSLRLQMRDAAFIAEAAGALDPGTASPLSDPSVWKEFDNDATCWLPLLEDMASGRCGDAGSPEAMIRIAKRAGRALVQTRDGDAGMREAVAIWDGIARASSSDPETAAEILHTCLLRSERSQVESRLVRFATRIPDAEARKLIAAFVSATGDPGAWLRSAWTCVNIDSPAIARACADAGLAAADAGALAVLRHERDNIEVVIERRARLRAPARPPR